LNSYSEQHPVKELGKDNNEERRNGLIEDIRNDSVMRCGNFNLHGEYDFLDEQTVDSIVLKTLTP
jgi:hypothetical protein